MEYHNWYIFALTGLGILVLLNFIFENLWNMIQSFKIFLQHYFLLTKEPISLREKFGKWSLITGCTDGIGKAYAFELAKRGINVVLVSRTEEKLKKVEQEIQDKYSVKTKIIAADFSNGEKAIEKIKNNLDGIEVDILVNNVGKQYDYPMYLGEVKERDLWDIITINVGAVTLLSRFFIEEMKQRKRGVIVNISSGSEYNPLPLMTVYGATKAYIKNFSKALRFEYKSSGVTIQHLSPMFVNTKMNHFSHRLRENSLFIPDAESWAKYAISTLGIIDESSGYWSHGLQIFVLTLAPTWLTLYIGYFLNKGFREDHLNKKIC